MFGYCCVMLIFISVYVYGALDLLSLNNCPGCPTKYTMYVTNKNFQNTGRIINDIKSVWSGNEQLSI